MHSYTDLPLGATYSIDDAIDGVCDFLVWAPRAKQVEVHILGAEDRFLPMDAMPRGYFHARVRGAVPGTLYRYRLDAKIERPDPVSRLQPQGVHGPSQVVERNFPWQDESWRGLALRDYVLYELHAGTFTAEGNFEAMIPRLPAIKALGVTAIELMPVAQFPGNRNWGYDGVYPYAVQHSYGGPAGLKKLVNACHQQGLAVVLDVVYNHLGPEGNYLADFGPYFTSAYHTPWGDAINYDKRQSDEVRRFFIGNALEWIAEFHVDALRLDAVHAIVDPSARPFLQELGAAVHSEAERLQRRVYLIPESDRNNARLVAAVDAGGAGLDAVWNDDFHHALHVLLTGETNGYYEDFGTVEQLARAFSEGFVYSGQYSRYRQRSYGNSSLAVPAERFVVFAQNHDQVGNRRLGDRLSSLVSFASLKLAAGVLLLSPFVPLLFMGEEYGETAPFQYFVSHGDTDLVEAVRKGRSEEFSHFGWGEGIPDPQGEETFRRCVLHWESRASDQHHLLLALYTELLRLRRELAPLARQDKHCLEAVPLENSRALFLRRWSNEEQAFAVFYFGESEMELQLPVPAGRWKKQLDSDDPCWGGQGGRAPEHLTSKGEVHLPLAPRSFVLFLKGLET
ncbi:MAG TPA: malto-oligosyltrehalose trehalohydrolase [Candidatus Dormibacteraeota bacterium]|nr:malto-oligosyltrehalose trehalohydrolase [Candidatus Dormibacteraeota bacterium]